MDRVRWWNRRRRQALVAAFHGEVPVVFYVGDELVARTVDLLAHDVVATLRWSGERAEELVRGEAQN